MVIYNGNQNIKAGLPMGGIGAGKIEIDNKGKIINVTILNNWSDPLQILQGFHIFIKPDNDDGFFLEKEINVLGFENNKLEISYEGKYPITTIEYKHKKIKVKLQAFSPIIAKDISSSTLPAVGFKISVSGCSSGNIYFSFPNIIGSGSAGRVNRRLENGILFTNSMTNDYDPSAGEICLVAEKLSNIFTQHNILPSPNERRKWEKKWYGRVESGEFWSDIDNGKTPASESHEVTGSRDLPAGTINSKFKDGEEMKFVLSWYITGKGLRYPYGHFYHLKFKNSIEISKMFLDNFDDLLRRSLIWQHELVPVDLPDWLKDAIINSTYILSSSTWFDEKGRFSIYESPERCPFLGTIAGLCYEGGSLPILKLFPELEKSFLDILTEDIRKDGYVPHDLGLHSLDVPMDGTTAPPEWKDTNPTFILLVYRYYYHTRDKNFLKGYFPALERALNFSISQDVNDDGLPEQTGSFDTAFDNLFVKGTDTYVGSIWIAALEAYKEILVILEKKDDIASIQALIDKARMTMEKFYNGKYFKAWEGDPDSGDAVFAGQMIGQWWCETLGLRHISSEEKIKSSLEEIVNVNGKASQYCLPIMVYPNLQVSTLCNQTYSSWPRLTFALGALGYLRDKEKWLEIVKKEWNNIFRLGLIYDQPSRIHYLDGHAEDNYLDHYIGNATLWSFIRN
ncbi:MAG: GH116 family glycosyl hydrolase [Candidatus Thermoplasmatota archaeon]|nr:GH116 family glycosyl hydrolase [Candidatus Thermoplasmatota archaeon]